MSERPDAARRSFLTGALLTRQGRSEAKRVQRPLGPLPPWHHTLTNTCDTCLQDCMPACPQSIIRLHPDGHDMAGRPYLDFTHAGCTFCGECASACKQLPDSVDDRPTIGAIRINPGTCLAMNGVLCMSCLSPCEYRALSLNTRRQPVVDEASCTGCGACIPVCPANAIVFELVN